MEFGSIERELHIDASPEIVWEVITSPEHIRDWWNADAELAATSGATGRLAWTDAASARTDTVALTVVTAEPPHRFAFRWAYDDDVTPTASNSLLVSFELIPAGSGTTLRFAETGFRERGWEVAVLEQHYRDHTSGWDTFLPRLAARATTLVANR